MLLLNFGCKILEDRYLKVLYVFVKLNRCEISLFFLLSLEDLSIPILVPFLAYNKHMVKCESMKVSVMVTDKQKPNNIYLAAQDIVLLNPPISITVSRKPLSLCLSIYHLSSDFVQVSVTLVRAVSISYHTQSLGLSYNIYITRQFINKTI